MVEAVQKSFELVAGIENNNAVSSIESGPSASTMSRSCMKLDLAHMIIVQEQWSRRNQDNLRYMVQLSLLAWIS